MSIYPNGSDAINLLFKGIESIDVTSSVLSIAVEYMLKTIESDFILKSNLFMRLIALNMSMVKPVGLPLLLIYSYGAYDSFMRKVMLCPLKQVKLRLRATISISIY